MTTDIDKNPAVFEVAMEAFGKLIYAQRDRLPMFIVYDHPADVPDRWVARLWFTLPQAEPTPHVIAMQTLDEIQTCMIRLGLAKLDRDPSDDPKITESWI